MTALVGIVTHNRAGTVPRAIMSALAQTGCETRVTVVDDGSTDQTPMLADQFPSVRWVRWEENKGCILSRTYLMESATEDYYVSLDDDAWFMRGDEIALAVELLENKPAVAAVAFDILSHDKPQLADRREGRQVAMFIGCGHVIRLSAIRVVGGYEATPGPYGSEEKDLCLRLMDAGYEIVRLPGVHVWHEKTGIARVISEQHTSGVCNDLALALRRTPASLLPLALLVKVYKQVKFSWRSGLTRPCIRGLMLFARSFFTVWRLRRPVRTATLRAFMRLSI